MTLVFSGAITSSACFDTNKTALPGEISFTQAALYPEGIDYDEEGERFLVSSMRYGTVGTVSDTGKYKELINDPMLVSSVGIRVDNDNNRVLVCNSDPGTSVKTTKETQGRLAGLGIYNLSTGKKITYIDLATMTAGNHFCNDIALDDDGNAYVSDSFSTAIYKIDIENKASLFLDNKRFAGKGFNLNGLVVKDDFLIVAKYNEGLLFKVPLNDPERFTQILANEPMPGADGLLWHDDGSLIVIANTTSNKVFKLNSTDGWHTATITKTSSTGEVFATTGVNRDGNIYVLNAMLQVLFNPKTKTHIESFDIRKHDL